MRKKAARFLSILSILILAGWSIWIQESFSESKKNFLWKVQSGTNTVYVLGAIHYLKQEVYPLDQRIEQAFDQSDILVVEVNANHIKEADIQKATASAFYPENETLEQHLSRETYGLLKKELKELGGSLEAANRYQPWFLALSLVTIETLKLGFDPNYGIDRYFLSKAAEKKKVLELESFDYQMNLLSSLTGKEQNLFLLYTLKDLRVLKQKLDPLIKAWTSGDVKGLEAIVTKSVSEDKRLIPIYNKLIYERNRNMASKIEDYLRTRETYYVVVGASHLVGRQGLIAILHGKGYRVEQL